ncbi:hypothetical protein Trydic_g9551 [Trypoxylus dichotomus]
MDDLTATVTVHPIRAVELPLIKRKHKAFFREIVGHANAAGSQDKYVTFKEYVVCSLILQYNVSSVMHIIEMGLKYGSGNIVLAYLLVQLCLGLPLVMLCCFLSSYVKKSFISFWECVPMLEGIGYSMIFVQLFVQMTYLLTTASSLLFFIDLTHYRKREIVTNCGLSGGNRLCYTPGANTSYICTKKESEKTTNNIVYTALQYHLRHNIMKYDQFNLNCCQINTKFVVIVISLWILIFLVSVLGLTRIKKPVVNGMITISVLLTVVCAYSAAFFQIKTDSSLSDGSEYREESVFLQFDFWVDMIVQLGEGNSMSSTLWLGSLKRHDYAPQGVLIAVICLKALAAIGLFCFTNRVIFNMMNIYGFEALHCMHITGYDLLMAFIPEALLRIHIGGVGALFWYFCIFLLSILPPILITMEITSSLVERYRIVDDYNFTYGKPPARYWIIFWKYSPLIGLITLVFTIYKMRTIETQEDEQYLVILSYAEAIFCGLPIILTGIIKCCTHAKHKPLATLMRPADTWGPHNPAKRGARKYFYPQRDIKYRNTTLKCVHTCIVNSGIYHEETRTNQVKLNREIKRVQKQYNYDFSDLQTD